MPGTSQDDTGAADARSGTPAALPAPEAVEILRAMRSHRLSVNEQLRAMEPGAMEKGDPFPLMVLRGGIEFTEWFADWCERMEQQLLKPAPEKRSS